MSEPKPTDEPSELDRYREGTRRVAELINAWGSGYLTNDDLLDEIIPVLRHLNA